VVLAAAQGVQRSSPRPPTRTLPSRWRWAWPVPCALAAWLWTDSAHADCAVPPASIDWTYPAESTESVPPDAVFWVVSQEGDITVEVDGVRVPPLGTSHTARLQFKPETPLSEGEHEFVALTKQELRRVDDLPDSGAYIDTDERRFRFQVTAAPAVDGDVSVSGVTLYSRSYGGPPQRSERPEEDACSAAATPLSWYCNDTGGPLYVARIGYAAEGSAIAYLVQGDYLVPPGCASFWWDTWSVPGPEQVRVAAVLPTGLAEEHAFAGPVEDRTTVPNPNPGSFAGRPSACSLDFEQRPASRSLLAATTLLVLGACARRRTRRSRSS
jgi:hypothetical protein